MRQTQIAVVISVVGSWSLGSFAFGQAATQPTQPTQRPPVMAAIPLGLPLGKVPVGRWAEYQMPDGKGAVMSLRMVIVAHHQKTSDIETVIEGGDMTVLGRTALRSSIYNDTGADLHPDQHVVQMGSSAPMLIPMQIAGGTPQNFRKPDPKQQVGVESLTVRAGTFARAIHYRERTASGDVVDTWVSRDVPPFGLLKLEAGTAAQGARLVMELTAHGENAKAVITTPVRPFDRVALIKQLQPLIAAQRTAPPRAAAGQSAASSQTRAGNH